MMIMTFQLQEDGAMRHHQDRVDQAAREWEAMTFAEKTQVRADCVVQLHRDSVQGQTTKFLARRVRRRL